MGQPLPHGPRAPNPPGSPTPTPHQALPRTATTTPGPGQTRAAHLPSQARSTSGRPSAGDRHPGSPAKQGRHPKGRRRACPNFRRCTYYNGVCFHVPPTPLECVCGVPAMVLMMSLSWLNWFVFELVCPRARLLVPALVFGVICVCTEGLCCHRLCAPLPPLAPASTKRKTQFRNAQKKVRTRHDRIVFP